MKNIVCFWTEKLDSNFGIVVKYTYFDEFDGSSSLHIPLKNIDADILLFSVIVIKSGELLIRRYY